MLFEHAGIRVIDQGECFTGSLSECITLGQVGALGMWAEQIFQTRMAIINRANVKDV